MLIPGFFFLYTFPLHNLHISKLKSCIQSCRACVCLLGAIIVLLLSEHVEQMFRLGAEH